jgi:hypothetical protein
VKRLYVASTVAFASIGLIRIILAVPPSRADAPLRLIQKIPLTNLEGRIDHLDADVKGKRLFVAGLGNGSLEVVDLQGGKWPAAFRALRSHRASCTFAR